MIVLYTFLLVAYLVITAFTTAAIVRSDLLSAQQKRANVLISLFLPLLWFWLIRPHLSAATPVMTKAERERLLRKGSGSNLGDEIGSSIDAGSGGMH